MKVFIINLKQATDRKEYISELCHKYALDFEIIEAIYGKELSESFVKDITDEPLSKKVLGRTLRPGEIGCALSHKKCFERMFALALDEALILEDDASFDEKLLYVLSLKAKFPKDLELLLLGHERQVYGDDGFRIDSPYSRRFDLALDENYHLKRLAGGGFGTHAYYINAKGAKKMHTFLAKIIYPYDHCTSNDKVINVYALHPVVVLCDEFFGKQTYVQSEQQKTSIKKKSLLAKYFKRLRKELLFFLPSLRKLKKYE